jgi:hypothetical protein
VEEVLTATTSAPVERLRLEAIEKIGYSLCTICGCMFHRGTKDSFSEFVERQGLRGNAFARAVESGRGVTYWLDSVDPRVLTARSNIHVRRYVYPDCVANLWADAPA